MLVTNHRVYYLNSDMIIDSGGNNPSNRYKKTITLPSFDEDYSHVSLLHAVIPNSFPTIQEDTNDYISFNITIDYGKEWVDDNKPDIETMNVSLKILEGFYAEDQILKLINQKICNLTYNDFGIRKYTDDSEDPIVPLIQGRGNLFELDNSDDNQTNHIKVANKMNVIYNQEHPVYWIKKIEIYTKDLSYKILGIPRNNYYLCFDNFSLDEIPNNSAAVLQIDFPFKQLPYRPTLLWVTSISIRLDIVNIMEDSNVLQNIPVIDPMASFISYQNNDILNTSKKFNTTYTNGQINIQITQQNGYELNLDNIEFNLDIVVFKV